MSNRGINKVILIGHLGQDPEIRYMPNGNAVANITLATSETWRDKQSGEQKEKTEWHRVVFFGKLAEIVGEYVKKGSQIYVEGRLQTRKWQGQDGQDKYTTEVVVDVGGTMQMLGGRPQGGNQQQGNQQQGSQQQGSQQQGNQQQGNQQQGRQQQGHQQQGHQQQGHQQQGHQQQGHQQQGHQQQGHQQQGNQPQGNQPQNNQWQGQPPAAQGSPAQGWDPSEYDDDIPF